MKPGNVLIAANGLVKLTDFGVSRAVDEVQLTRTGVIAGTPAYLAPEVAQGREPNAASDVFALGARSMRRRKANPRSGSTTTRMPCCTESLQTNRGCPGRPVPWPGSSCDC